MNIDFCPLASGSSGNCIYLAANNTNILIDAGLSGIKIEKALYSINVNPSLIDAIFITHEHSDHITGAGILSRRFGIPIIATEGTWEYININKSLGKIKPENMLVIKENKRFVFKDFTVKPFPIPHDAWNPVGYSFFSRDFKVTIATDMGHISDIVSENLSESNILLIEANHDVDMLKNGSYPFHLKRRILSEKGHLSNIDCGKALLNFAGQKLKHVYLGHLSQENNIPTLAYEAVRAILRAENIQTDFEPGETCKGTGLNLYLADRCAASKFLRVAV